MMCVCMARSRPTAEQRARPAPHRRHSHMGTGLSTAGAELNAETADPVWMSNCGGMRREALKHIQAVAGDY